MDVVAVDAKWGGDSIEAEEVSGARIVRVPVKSLAPNVKRNVVQELFFGICSMSIVHNMRYLKKTVANFRKADHLQTPRKSHHEQGAEDGQGRMFQCRFKTEIIKKFNPNKLSK